MTLLIDAVAPFITFETETEEVRSLTQRRRSHDYMRAGGFPGGYFPGRYPGGYMGAYGGGFDGGYLSGFQVGYGRIIPPLNPRVYTDPAPI
ncbi:unnamed protein product [Toxocara canis]|nr:unnamed protein product [Toxocara canis]